jgi:hypothetical protein
MGKDYYFGTNIFRFIIHIIQIRKLNPLLTSLSTLLGKVLFYPYFRLIIKIKFDSQYNKLPLGSVSYSARRVIYPV